MYSKDKIMNVSFLFKKFDCGFDERIGKMQLDANW